MRASLEVHAGTIRVHDDGDGFGDPYEWACTVTFTPDGEAWLSGVVRPVTPAIWRAVRQLFAQQGVREAVWERRKEGEPPREVRVKVNAVEA